MTRLLFFIHKMVQALIEIGQYQRGGMTMAGFDDAVILLPPRLRRRAEELPALVKRQVEEFRLRAGQMCIRDSHRPDQKKCQPARIYCNSINNN